MPLLAQTFNHAPNGAHDRLTTAANEEMIRRMHRNVSAGLLILGWITLSGLDVLEDFKHLHGQLLVSSASSPEHVKSRNGWGTLANNIVESATRIAESPMAFARSTATIGGGTTIVDFRGYFLRHKLYRVFLI
jgi:hypothetical protein